MMLDTRHRSASEEQIWGMWTRKLPSDHGLLPAWHPHCVALPIDARVQSKILLFDPLPHFVVPRQQPLDGLAEPAGDQVEGARPQHQ